MDEISTCTGERCPWYGRQETTCALRLQGRHCLTARPGVLPTVIECLRRLAGEIPREVEE